MAVDELEMHFGWSEKCRKQLERARQFAEEHLAQPRNSRGLDHAAWRDAANFGIFQAAMQLQADGRRGGGALASAALLEAMGRGGAQRSLLFALGAHLFGSLVPFAAYATSGQRAEWEQKLRNGSATCALAVTEMAGGSSLDNIETEAIEVPGGFQVTGRKTLIGNAPDASLFIVFARHGGRRGPMSFTTLMLAKGTSGLSVIPEAARGLAGAPTGALYFDRCFVPTAAVLGRPGGGFGVFSTAMLWERSCLLAGFLGSAERDLRICIDFLANKRDAGGSLLRHQAISHRLARMRLSLDGARLMLYRAAWTIDQGRNNYAIAAMAKLAVSEAVVDAAQDTFRLLAGAGWRGEVGNPVTGVADALAGLLASGTSDIQLELIARQMYGEPHR